MSPGVVGNTTPKHAWVGELSIGTQQTCDFTQLSSREHLSRLSLVPLIFLTQEGKRAEHGREGYRWCLCDVGSI